MSPPDLAVKNGIATPPTKTNQDIEKIATDRPLNLLAALNCSTVVAALDADSLRCVTTDLSTLARLSEPSKGRRHHWRREEIEHRLAGLPCDPPELRPIIERIMPARLLGKASGSSTLKSKSIRIMKRWSTIKSSTRRVLRLAGWLEGDALLNSACTQEWRVLRDTMDDSDWRRIARPFVVYCCCSGVRPDGVSEDTLEGYRRLLVNHTLQLHVGQKINHLRMIWNRQVRTNTKDLRGN
jgi:hypothetical protein